MARTVLIVARADVGPTFKAELEALHGGFHGRIATEKYRRATDAPGVFSHYVAHGEVPERVWDSIVAALNTATGGVRDSVDWQGKPGTDVSDALWAVAYEGADVVAGFRITSGGVSAVDVLAGLGLVAITQDAAP
jgi:hypothetical protein